MITSSLKSVSKILAVVPLLSILTVAGCNSRGAGSGAADSTVPVPLNDDGRKLLKAVESGDQTTVQDMIRDNPDLLRVQGELGSPLFVAVTGPGDVQIAKALIKAGADPNALDPSGNTPLNIVVRGKETPVKVQLADLLLTNKANPNARTKGGKSTPLHIAGFYGNLNEVKLLVAHGADLKATDGSGQTALQLVRRTEANFKGGSVNTNLVSRSFNMENYPQIIQFLTQAGGKPTAAPQPTPLSR